MHTCLLLLGSNLGDKEKIISDAIFQIHENLGQVSKSSSLYLTAPWGFESQNDFLNLVIEVKTSLKPGVLLEEIHKIESALGRIREDTDGYQSRSIDIDILFYDDARVEEKNLVIPHEKLHLRLFTLLPLSEIAEEWIHPVFGVTVAQLLKDCVDTGKVKKINRKPKLPV